MSAASATRTWKASAVPTILAPSPLTRVFLRATPSPIFFWACPRKPTSRNPAPTFTHTPRKPASTPRTNSASAIALRSATACAGRRFPRSSVISTISPHSTFATAASSFPSETSRGPAFSPPSTPAIPPIPQTSRTHAAPPPADTALGCLPVLGASPGMPCAPVEFANRAGLGPGLRQFYGKNFQPRLGFAYRPFADSKIVIRGGFGIFTMTNLGQLSFNTTNIDVSVVRTTANSFTNNRAAYQFPSVRTPDNPAIIAGTGDFYQNTLTNYRDPQS